jgi:hypothetical protein
MQNLQYPIGRFTPPTTISSVLLDQYLEEIASFPALLREVSEQLDEIKLDTPYRPEGWTARQVIHHCADSHMNSFIRFKLALTEDNPTIKPYFEDRWAAMKDAKNLPIEPSLRILEGLHERWIALIKTMDAETMLRTFYHPEKEKSIRLDQTIALYAWHGRHHLGHVKSVLTQDME